MSASGGRQHRSGGAPHRLLVADPLRRVIQTRACVPKLAVVSHVAEVLHLRHRAGLLGGEEAVVAEDGLVDVLRVVAARAGRAGRGGRAALLDHGAAV
eukprot:CAMPEP_0179364966 /NCGR_PEP_ID=MMETSP0797-20121207/82310_1 /TAXON_ID=47934 /ORGANISM="Dinophysis acuminata, Strain DAEP01" /LENGTH=97 /DNA_ID=CAMNT_0021080459 /DNA_START=43 /DNA_END=333 /DNA_ORIENTATION=-